jgi:catechol 2,3-dioxygenase-like lactoylglutathione lyase family enzyme
MDLIGVSHTGITVSDLGRSLAFYRDVLGMKVMAQQVGTAPYLTTMTGFPGVRLKVAFLKVHDNSEHVLELLEYASHPGPKQEQATNRPGNCHLCFMVEDIWNMYESLRANGVHFKSEPTPITAGVNAGGYGVYLLDPDGVTLELFQPPPRPRTQGPRSSQIAVETVCTDKMCRVMTTGGPA